MREPALIFRRLSTLSDFPQVDIGERFKALKLRAVLNRHLVQRWRCCFHNTHQRSLHRAFHPLCGTLHVLVDVFRKLNCDRFTTHRCSTNTPTADAAQRLYTGSKLNLLATKSRTWE